MMDVKQAVALIVMMAFLMTVTIIPWSATASGIGSEGVLLNDLSYVSVNKTAATDLSNSSIAAVTIETLVTLDSVPETGRLVIASTQYTDYTTQTTSQHQVGVWRIAIVDSDTLEISYQGRKDGILGSPAMTHVKLYSGSYSFTEDTYRFSMVIDYNGATLKGYVNGAEIVSSSLVYENSLRPRSVNQDIHIGADVNFAGKVHDFRLWHEARTASQIDNGKFEEITTGPEISLSFDEEGGDGYRLMPEWYWGPPIEIRTLDDLDGMRDYPLANYILINDIDASATETWNDGEGWEPFLFNGRLDGNYRIISNLHINRPDQNHTGLFSTLGGDAIVQSLVLTVDVHGASNTGGLAGKNSGEIRQVHVSGDVTSDNGVAGGIVGTNEGLIATVSSFADVTAMAGNAGGIAGAHSAGTIMDSYTRDATITASGKAGGIAGSHWFSSVYRCYVASSLVDTDYEYYESPDIHAITPSQVPTIVAGGNYWDWEVTGTNQSSTGAGKNSTQMGQQTTFIGWDFELFWAIDEGYPNHRWMGFAPALPEDPAPVTPESPLTEVLEGGMIYSIIAGAAAVLLLAAAYWLRHPMIVLVAVAFAAYLAYKAIGGI